MTPRNFFAGCVAILLFSAGSAGGSEPPEVVALTAAEIRERVKGDWKAAREGAERPVFIDLRSQTLYAAGHFTGSRRLDFRAADYAEKVAKLDRDRAYVVYCQDGSVSEKALALWKTLKFRKLYHLKGGWKAYEDLISGKR